MNCIGWGFQIVVLALAVSSIAAPGKKVFHIGNSLTDQAYGMHDIAKSKGYDPIIWGRFTIPGAPIHWCWSHPGNAIINGSSSISGGVISVLENNPWDALVLQSFPQNGDNANTVKESGGNYAEVAYKGNPNCQVYIFGSHLSLNDDWTTGVPRFNTIAVNGADGISARFPTRKKVLVIPVFQALDRAKVLVGQGQAPGISSFSDLFMADAGHLNNNGRYLECLVHFATIYKQNPIEAGTTFYGFTVSATWAATAQKIAWEVVTSYPQSGVTTTAVVPFKLETEKSLLTGNNLVSRNASNLLGQMIRMNSSVGSEKTTRGAGVYIYNNGAMSKKGTFALENVK